MNRPRFLPAASSAPLFLALVALVFPGCAGYHMGSIKPQRMEGIKTIAVPSFINKTLEPRMEVLLANTVIKQIQQDGTYQIAREADADAVLEGTLEEIDRRPERSVRGNVLLTREYSLILRVRYRVYNRATGVDLEGRAVTGRTTFFVSGSNALAADVQQDERQALPIAAEDLSVRLVSQIAEGW
ncbi:MAG: LptE family protein [Chthoniobacteraceae bacterium]